jgi:drug/metabolite transporter (DMT)-like permease
VPSLFVGGLSPRLDRRARSRARRLADDLLGARAGAAGQRPFALVGDLSGGTGAWLGFAYVCLFSMFLGFFAWYAGLARGGVAKIGQIQHAQPVLTLAWSALALGETITTGTAVAAAVVLLFVFATQRTRVGSRPAPLVASRQ